MVDGEVKDWREGAMVTSLNTGVARILGRGQIFFGCAAAVCQIILIAINSDRGVPFLAAGIWAGFFFVLAGFAAIAAAARPTRYYLGKKFSYNLQKMLMTVFLTIVLFAVPNVNERNYFNPL